MNIRVGYIPYLNMVPFHQGFGPEAIELEGRRFEFHTMSPNELGQEASKGLIDVGALSLVDWFRSSSQFEALGSYGIGLKRSAQSVFLFSDRPIWQLQGTCLVTDETSTSFRLLQILVEAHYGLTNVQFSRITPQLVLDNPANAILLIGDQALRARKEGIPGLPVVTDLGEEWHRWQNVPFVFARWAIRQSLRHEVKEMVEYFIQKSLKKYVLNNSSMVRDEAEKRRMMPHEVAEYWAGFSYILTPEHERSMEIFSELFEKVCLTA